MLEILKRKFPTRRFLKERVDSLEPIGDVDDLIKLFGGPGEAAMRLGTTAQAVCNWRLEGKLPAGRFLTISLELEKIGKIAPLSMFGIEDPRERNGTTSAISQPHNR